MRTSSDQPNRKRDRPSPPFTQVGVEPAGFRQHPRQAGDRERAAQRDDAAEDPHAQHDPWVGEQPGDSGRGSEDAGPNRDADDEPD